MVVCLERGAALHMAQLMPLPLTVSCFSKVQTGFTFLVPAHLGSPGQRAVKRLCCLSLVAPRKPAAKPSSAAGVNRSEDSSAAAAASVSQADADADDNSDYDGDDEDGVRSSSDSNKTRRNIALSSPNK